MTLRVLPVLSLLALAFAVVPAPAEASYVHHLSTAVTGPTDYAWREVTTAAAPNDCVKWEFWANITSSTRSGWAGAFWVATATSATGVFLIHQPSTDRLILHYQASQFVLDGFPPQHGSFAWKVNVGDLIGPLCGIKRVGFVAPDAVNAHVKWSFNSAPTVVNSGSGSEGFLHTREDFFGTWAESVPVGNPFDAGVSVGLAMSKKVTMASAGLLAGLITTATDSRLQVDGPTGFTTIHADCNAFIPKQAASCSSTGGKISAVGQGKVAQAPAGDYTFRVVRSAAISGVHVYVVGAPFAW